MNKDDTIDHIVEAVGKFKWKNIPERTKPWLQQEVFHKYRSETNMMRYIHELVSKDFTLSKRNDTS